MSVPSNGREVSDCAAQHGVRGLQHAACMKGQIQVITLLKRSLRPKSKTKKELY